MEEELFDWENWDVIEEGKEAFYRVKLNKPIGSFNIGDMFDYAFIDTATSTLVLGYNKPNEEYHFRLHYSVGERI